MKMSRIALAMLVAAPFAAAQAGVTVTPLMVGYHWYPSKVDKKFKDWTNDSTANVKNDLVVGAAIGAELTPWLQAEVEYQQTKPDLKFGDGTKNELKHETVSLNFIGAIGNPANKIKPYGLLGGGYSKIKSKSSSALSTKDTIGNAGVGVLWELNDALTLRTEARGVYNFDNKWWEGQGLAALQVVLGGHLRPAAPVVEVEPTPAPMPEPEPEPVVEQAPESHEEVQNLQLELRVFFDTNKSVIKQQYKPEVAKVAQFLNEVPNATAQIEGHTDNTGPRKLNERLSLARANAVKSSLVNEFGVDASRLSTQGFAWDQPIATNKTAEGRAMNRRVFATITGSRTVTVQP